MSSLSVHTLYEAESCVYPQPQACVLLRAVYDRVVGPRTQPQVGAHHGGCIDQGAHKVDSHRTHRQGSGVVL